MGGMSAQGWSEAPDVLDHFQWWGGGEGTHADIPSHPTTPQVPSDILTSENFDELSDDNKLKVEKAWFRAARKYWKAHFPWMVVPGFRLDVDELTILWRYRRFHGARS
jgi:hypothetical protein